MKRRACSSCDRPMRKGTGRAAFVLDTDGDLKPGIVCLRCASRIVQVVTPPPTTVAPACTECKRAPASVCRHCVDALVRNVQELAAANTVLRRVSPAAGSTGELELEPSTPARDA